MMTMTGSCLLLTGWRFASEERIEKTGTMMNSVQKGKGWRYHGKDWGR